MPVLNIYKLDGSQAGTVEVNNEIFGIEPNKTVMHEVLVAELAELRQGTASTKTRAEVRGGGRKPFRQKGTGRARQGSTRAPHMVGGGVVHGPKPRDYVKKVNKKVRKLALRSALATKINEGNLIVLDDFALETPKTKTFVNFAKTLDFAGQKQLFVVNDFTEDRDYNLYMSVRNIEKTFVLDSRELRIFWLIKQDKVILTKEALAAIEEVLA
ncbi:50S ribosomal protein L4 [Leptotrichia sp. oral taxon 215 str. W9775]|jgi:50S ribosomal protein L4|uniref:50S ribosomal protein L4 n=1 Tax=Leptotrichia sp. oral taxon 215 TaxID=712359 RepID=UPI0003ADB6C3|nr:50S ribosomal protein L4 [Leptotrichia sp. oral taxon 215]ERK68764.1 50S ribosomal protein L4 [Leptotrichia sp. oral taxon 215 str. W9775]MBF1332704.1 50S ribosomal protein L4 [Leptotrichia sp.]MBF1335790.1 50S ribosomal protein L4 [Leptotrichia sp.]